MRTSPASWLAVAAVTSWKLESPQTPRLDQVRRQCEETQEMFLVISVSVMILARGALTTITSLSWVLTWRCSLSRLQSKQGRRAAPARQRPVLV